MLAAIGNRWKDYCVNFAKVAVGKPRLDSMSQEMVGLILFLCLWSLNLGEWLGHVGSSHSSGRSLNFLIATMLVLNWVAFQFRWSRGLTVFLRIGALVLMGGVFVVLFFGA